MKVKHVLCRYVPEKLKIVKDGSSYIQVNMVNSSNILI